jgi:hypothetical protein
MNKVIERALTKIKEKNYRNYFLYAFDKDAVKKKYLKNSTLKRKRKIYINS